MRALRQLGQALAAFITGHEHAICLLRAERDHLPWVHATLHEQSLASPDVFLPFPHAFASASDYAQTITDACLACAKIPAPPPALTNLHAPLARVRAALEIARDTLLPRGTCPPRLVVVLAPLTVGAADGWLAFARALLAEEAGWPPWFHRLRLFVHLPPTVDPGPLPRFVRALDVDLSLAALATSVHEAAADPSATPEQRAQALLQAAALDAARGHHQPAIAAYRELHAWAAGAQHPVFEALALAGLGDVEAARKDSREAVAWYERALVPASATGSAMILLLITRSLARLYLECGRHADAETFFDGAQRLATLVPDAATHAEALAWRARLEERRGARQQAATTYLAAARVAQQYEHGHLLADLRTRLAACESRVPPALAREIAAFLEHSP